MRYILLFLLIGFSALSHSSEAHPEFPDYELVSKTKNDQLKVGRTKMIFYINGLPSTGSPARIVWSANRYIDTISLAEPMKIEEVLKSGKYNFKFFYSTQYKEIIISKMVIESGYTYTININFKPLRNENMNVRKPVIYFYPEETIDINIQLQTTGNLTFSYPEYPEGGWQITGSPDGNILAKGEQLNYLFWESEQDPGSVRWDHSTGFLVEGEDVMQFLDSTLTVIGLNSKEKADFITYWGPILKARDLSIVHFLFNEGADQFGKLKIMPQPDHICRIYLLFEEINDQEIPILKKQDLSTLTREGFTVIEWGGSELPAGIW